MNKVVNWIAAFLFKYLGYEALTDRIESKVTSYRIRLNIVPVSFKIFVWSLGLITGSTGTYIYLNHETEPQWTFEQPIKIETVQAKEESVQEIIERVAKENNFEDIQTLLKIAKCESNFDRYAKNSQSSARGIFQILDMHELTEDERYNPEIATEWTINEIRKNGTKPWNASKHCWNK